MKILIPLNIPDKGIDLLKSEGLEVTKWTKDLPMTKEELYEAAAKHDALLSTSNYKLDAEFLNSNKHLKIISQYAAGYDNIDVEEAKKLGIPIANAPNSMTDATADIAFALVLAVSRKMFHMHKTIAKGEWRHFKPQANLGIELKNKTVGVFGLGRIGLEFARRCKGAYGMDVLYCNRSVNLEAEEQLQAKKVDFSELLEQSDVISVHCALTPETKFKFDAGAFKKMKPTSIFVNTARGQVHNEKDLIAALENSEIWGAGLDVTDPEPMRADNPLLSMEQVAVTPHIGSATVEARNQMSVFAARNILALYRGEPIPYPVF
ncbi:D-glycerate dehydrogenase [Zobellia amurskyensis]|uniref:Glyoxylate/hydroxypyruvate reductase B n=1 Tax=Zobellia amurskyensis TaxID=248905 RepID=A0A7X2ZUS9_9FLAO|nr:D-glycerate dehydrogenase [Zobellia amurskyensis]MUH36790.1 D-glycerate dehydrogenase [Zobellia amurskyensis]